MSPVHFGKAPKRPTFVPPGGGARVVEAARALGLNVGFVRPNCLSDTYSVRVYRPGASYLAKGLGQLSALSAMGDEALLTHIKTRWAQ